MLFGQTRRRIESLEMEVSALRRDVRQQQDYAWMLQGRIDRILEYLKVSEVTINKTVLRAKNGPEED